MNAPSEFYPEHTLEEFGLKENFEKRIKELEMDLDRKKLTQETLKELFDLYNVCYSNKFRKLQYIMRLWICRRNSILIYTKCSL
jgi:hypothetical protein